MPGSLRLSEELRVSAIAACDPAAAELWESLSQNHPFVDGNERVAVTVTAAFLNINEHRLPFINGLCESGRTKMPELERWLRQHVLLSDPMS